MAGEGDHPVLKMKAICTRVLGALLVFVAATAAAAEAPGSEVEYNLKAACLYNIAKFVEWPPASFASESDELVIAVFGENPFGDALEKVVQGRVIRERSVRVRYVRSAEEARGAHLVFFARNAREDEAEVLRELGRQGVLTVGEDEGFLQAGGMVQFMISDRKLRFAIAEPVAQQAGLKINSQLLSLAVPAREAG